jgi:hypothetical protein
VAAIEDVALLEAEIKGTARPEGGIEGAAMPKLVRLVTGKETLCVTGRASRNRVMRPRSIALAELPANVAIDFEYRRSCS